MRRTCDWSAHQDGRSLSRLPELALQASHHEGWVFVKISLIACSHSVFKVTSMNISKKNKIKYCQSFKNCFEIRNTHRSIHNSTQGSLCTSGRSWSRSPGVSSCCKSPAAPLSSPFLRSLWVHKRFINLLRVLFWVPTSFFLIWWVSWISLLTISMSQNVLYYNLWEVITKISIILTFCLPGMQFLYVMLHSLHVSSEYILQYSARYPAENLLQDAIPVRQFWPIHSTWKKVRFMGITYVWCFKILLFSHRKCAFLLKALVDTTSLKWWHTRERVRMAMSPSLRTTSAKMSSNTRGGNWNNEH